MNILDTTIYDLFKKDNISELDALDFCIELEKFYKSNSFESQEIINEFKTRTFQKVELVKEEKVVETIIDKERISFIQIEETNIKDYNENFAYYFYEGDELTYTKIIVASSMDYRDLGVGYQKVVRNENVEAVYNSTFHDVYRKIKINNLEIIDSYYSIFDGISSNVIDHNKNIGYYFSINNTICFAYYWKTDVKTEEHKEIYILNAIKDEINESFVERLARKLMDEQEGEGSARKKLVDSYIRSGYKYISEIREKYKNKQ